MDYIPPKPLKAPKAEKTPQLAKVAGLRGGGGFWPGLNPSMNTQAGVEIPSLEKSVAELTL
jgi:hypothetical protein